MAMEVMNNYSNYAAQYIASNSANGATGGTKKQDAEQTAVKAGSNKTESTADYFSKLAKLAPSVDCRIGTTYSSAKSGKTLTLNPQLLEKMQKNPEFEKDMMDMIKGVESMTRLSESINRATGWTTVFRHSYIDENGKYSHFAVIRNDFMFNMSDKLREERQKNSEKFMEKTKEKAAKKKEELQETLEEKRDKQEENKASKAEKLIKEKISASKDGRIFVNDSDFREIAKAIKEDNGKINTRWQMQAGINLDLQV